MFAYILFKKINVGDPYFFSLLFCAVTHSCPLKPLKTLGSCLWFGCPVVFLG
jgi:hypothetical protein